MSVVAEFKEVGPWKKQLSIEVPAAAVEAETQRVIETYRKNAKVPGFRKGKMPVSMVRQKFREEIEKEILDRLLPRYWQQASAEKSIDPLLPPHVEEVDFKLDEGLKFVATVEVRPEIELGDVENFHLPESDTTPSETEISEALEQLRKEASNWIEVERAAAEGDMVEVMVTEVDGGEGDEEPEARPAAFEIGDERVWTELSEAVDGLEAGGSANFEHQMPAAPPAESDAETEEAETEEAETEEAETDDAETGEAETNKAETEQEDPAPTKYKVEVTAVKERELPDLDDELAARLGDFGDLAALEARVSESIEEQKRGEDRRDRERQVLEQLRQRHPMTLPEGVVDMEIEGMLHEYADGMAQQGVDVQKAEIDWQQLADQVKPQARERVQSRLILDAIATSKEMELDGGELDQALGQLAATKQTNAHALRHEMEENGQLDRLRMQLMRHKTMLILLGEGAMEETTALEPEDPDEVDESE